MDNNKQKPFDDVAKPGTTPESNFSRPVVINNQSVQDDVINQDNFDDTDNQRLSDPVAQPQVIERTTVERSSSGSSSNNRRPLISINRDKSQPTTSNKMPAEKSAMPPQEVVDVVVKQKKSKKDLLIALLILIILLLFGALLAADAGLIKLPFGLKPPFNLIKEKSDNSNNSNTSNNNASNNDNRDTSVNDTANSEAVVPDGYVFYKNTSMGYKFAYPQEFGDFKPQDTYNSTKVSDLPGVQDYLVTNTPADGTILGVAGPFSLFNYKSLDKVVNSHKYGPTIKLINSKWIVVETNPNDPAKNQIGEEYLRLDGTKMLSKSQNGVTTYTFESTDESCSNYHIFVLGSNGLSELIFPTYCDGTYGSAATKKPIDKASYNKLYQNVSNSFSKL